MKRILSIAGKPGLYSLVSQGKNMLIVENVQTHRRMPAYASDKVMSLADIAIYTTDQDKPLYEVLQALSDKNGGKAVDLKTYDTPEKLREYFGEILPDFDRDRVHNNDIKKLFSWYNTLADAGITSFKDEEIKQDEAANAADPEAANASDTADNGLA